MAYLIDSDWGIDRLADDADAVTLLDRLAPTGISMSIISSMEAFQGTIREPDPAAAQAKLDLLLGSMPIVPLSLAIARRCAMVRELLRTRGRRVSSRALDPVVAATAIEHDLTLVTRNTRDYQDVPGLSIYGVPPSP